MLPSIQAIHAVHNHSRNQVCPRLTQCHQTCGPNRVRAQQQKEYSREEAAAVGANARPIRGLLLSVPLRVHVCTPTLVTCSRLRGSLLLAAISFVSDANFFTQFDNCDQELPGRMTWLFVNPTPSSDSAGVIPFYGRRNVPNFHTTQHGTVLSFSVAKHQHCSCR